jgi:hypothetical protein
MLLRPPDAPVLLVDFQDLVYGRRRYGYGSRRNMASQMNPELYFLSQNHDGIVALQIWLLINGEKYFAGLNVLQHTVGDVLRADLNLTSGA